MGRIQYATRYLIYLLRAKTKHDVHSPFVFALFTTVIQNKKSFYAYRSIEKLRAMLLGNKRTIEVKDFGAGSSVLKTNTRKVKDIVRHSAKPAKYAQLLFRLVNYFQPKTILELGTSLGISTLYLAMANSKTKVISIEGSETIATLARENFKLLNVENIELIIGNFDKVLPAQLQKINCADFVFFDGNHRKTPTLSYYEQCLHYAHNNSVFVFDDIHWSQEMEEAWQTIKQHPRVTITIDLFFMGLVFFKTEQAKEHFVLRF